MKSQIQLKIIDVLRTERIKHKYSQSQIGTLLGISNGQVGNIESPKMAHKYTLAQLAILCKEFDIRIEQLFLTDEDFLTDSDIISTLISKIVEYEN